MNKQKKPNHPKYTPQTLLAPPCLQNPLPFHLKKNWIRGSTYFVLIRWTLTTTMTTKTRTDWDPNKKGSSKGSNEIMYLPVRVYLFV